MDFPLKVVMFTGIGVDEDKEAIYGEFETEDKLYTFYVEGTTGRPYLQRKA